MIDDWSYLLRHPPRGDFLAACDEAGPDNERLQAVFRRFFRTWTTDLMGDDLRKLQILAADAQIRECVKIVYVAETADGVGAIPSDTSILWPRHQNGQVVAGEIGVEFLKSMFVTKRLRPDRLEVASMFNLDATDVPSAPDMAESLARDILDGADLAMTAFTVRNCSCVIELSPEHQGHGTGLSLLKKAHLCLNQGFRSYWATQILFHAPALDELSLTFWRFRNMSSSPPPIDAPLPKLRRLELSGARLSNESILSVVSSSKQSLTAVTLRHLIHLEDTTGLLSRISDDFPHLTSFKFTHLSEGPSGEKTIAYPGLDEDSVFDESDRQLLKLTVKAVEGEPSRISGVAYEGPNANHVLRIVAQHATTI